MLCWVVIYSCSIQTKTSLKPKHSIVLLTLLWNSLE